MTSDEPAVRTRGRDRPIGARIAAIVVLVLVVAGLGAFGMRLYDDHNGSANATAATSTTRSARTSNPVIPDACNHALNAARDGLKVVDDGLAALRNFDNAKLNDVLGRVEDLRPELTDSTSACRKALKR
jgi:hypothetical protein